MSVIASIFSKITQPMASKGITLLLFSLVLFASNLGATDHWGYVDANQEVYFEEPIVVLEAPVVTPKAKGQAVITKKLADDFKRNYGYRFGQSDTYRHLLYLQEDAFDRQNKTRITENSEVHIRQKDFGLYMVRRTIEFHVDRAINEDPKFKKIIEVKQAVSNINVKTDTGWKYNINYDLAGDHATLGASREDTKISMLIDSPFDPKEYNLYLYQKFNRNYSLHTTYLLESGNLTLYGRKDLVNNMRVTLTSSANTKTFETSDRRFILGFGISY